MPAILGQGGHGRHPLLRGCAIHEVMTDRRHVPPSARNIAMPGAVRRDVRHCLAMTLDRPSARSCLRPSASALDILAGPGQNCGAIDVAPSNWPRCLPRLAGRFFSRGGTAARRTSPSIVVTQGVEFQGNAGFLRSLRPRQGGRGSLPLLAASRLAAGHSET